MHPRSPQFKCQLSFAFQKLRIRHLKKSSNGPKLPVNEGVKAVEACFAEQDNIFPRRSRGFKNSL